ncbi:MAG: 3-deoxy-D-manno-octulosonic acid transferase [Planctomycetes bacterium]|nr:3-deoxy-D-manno-octulosonic acid transferase [Planctomycetota bacterium]
MAEATRAPSTPDAPRRAAPAPILAEPNPGPARFLLHAAYDLAWVIGIVGAAPWWITQCLRSPTFRAMAKARLVFVPLPRPEPARRRVLVHGVSVGEVKGAQALVRALRSAAPDIEVVISTTTETGLAVARKTYPDLQVVRFPLDPSWVVRRFLRRLAPVGVVLVELEIWPNFLRQSNRLGIPLAVVNGRITDRSYGRYRHFKNLLPQFNRLTLFCVQDEDYARRFRELSADPERILITGNIKVDGLRTGRVDAAPELVRLLAGRPGQPFVVAGSTHEPEERWIVEAVRAAAPDARLVIVPRHPERAKELVRTLAELGPAPQLLTALRAGEAPDPSRPALVDTIGELEQVYALADLVFIGGSLIPHGGQNMLEPAAQGRPVVFGPHVHNFVQEVALLERAGACVRLAGREELAPALARLLAAPEERARMAQAGIAAVEAQKGATALTLAALLERCLPPAARR